MPPSPAYPHDGLTTFQAQRRAALSDLLHIAAGAAIAGGTIGFLKPILTALVWVAG